MSALSLPARAAALPREALLRLVLKLDAAVTGANGLAYLAAAGPLEDLLGVEAAALRGIGTVLILFAAAVWFASTRAEPPRAAVPAIIAVNVAWVLGSLAFAAIGVSSPTTVGTVWIVLQAIVVAAFAAMQTQARPRR